MSRTAKILAWSGGVLLATLVLVVAVLLNFDWNSIKPWINSHVSAATGRAFEIQGNLSLTWHAPPGSQNGWRDWIPWPRLNARDVVFGNPDWAAEPDMAQARQVTFSVNPLPLLQHRIVIPSLALDEPQLFLQRLNDGRNNWTFTSSNPPSAWQFELRQLILTKGSAHLLDAIKHADLQAKIDTLDKDSDYQISWRVTGTFNGERVSGSGRAGSVLSLRAQQATYPIDAIVHFGKTTLDAKGTLTDPARLSALDMRLKISGVSMAQLYPVIHVVLPETPPFSTEGHLRATLNTQGGNWHYEKFSGKVGASDLSGSLHFKARKPRPQLEGVVESKFLNFSDLAPLIGADSNADKAQRNANVKQPDNKALPVETFKTDRLTSIDADVQFTGHQIVREKQLPIHNLVARIQLQDGVLSLAPLKFGIAGGSLVSTLKMNGKSNPMEAELKLSARHLKLKELFPTIESVQQTSFGEINVDATLTAAGNSVASLLGASNGEIKAVINQGAISKLLLEEIGLNIGSVIATKLFGDKPVTLNCAVNDFTIEKGVMHVRASVIDTEDETIYVDGNINLAQEMLRLKIRPDSKGMRVISLRSPLYVSGLFKKPNVDVDKSVIAAKAGSAIALGVLAPVATALIPLVNVGPGEKSECGILLAQAAAKPPASPPGGETMNASGR